MFSTPLTNYAFLFGCVPIIVMICFDRVVDKISKFLVLISISKCQVTAALNVGYHIKRVLVKCRSLPSIDIPRFRGFPYFRSGKKNVNKYGNGKEEVKLNLTQIRTCLVVKMVGSVVFFVLFSTWITVADLSEPVNCTLKVSSNSFHDIS